MSSRKVALLLTALIVALGAGCRKPAKVILTKDQRSRIDENILKEAPKTKSALDANFNDSIKLIGVDVSADKVKAGDAMSVTYYWECLKETAGEWKVFVHLEGPGGKRMVLDHVPVGELYPIAQWKKGDIIRDVQKFTLDADVKSGTATVWGGIFNEEIYREQGGGDRMKLVNKDKVPNDGDNRVRMITFAVEGKEAATPPKPAAALKAFKAMTAPVVDGKLDEPSWQTAASSSPFAGADGRAADAANATTVRTLWDDKNLYVGFHVLDKSIESTFKSRDDELWTQDVVEVYLDALADGKDYIELQVSPANVVFDALFKTHRTPDWKESKSFSIEGLQTAAVVTGTLNKAGDEDTSYDVELAVPLAAIPGLAKVPPDPGTTMRVNFFRMEAKDGKVIAAFAYSPTGGDFHDLSRAGMLEFATSPSQAVEKAGPTLVAPPGVIAPPSVTRNALPVQPRVLQAQPQPGVDRKPVPVK
jgi:hypothetical protein